MKPPHEQVEKIQGFQAWTIGLLTKFYKHKQPEQVWVSQANSKPKILKTKLHQETYCQFQRARMPMQSTLSTMRLTGSHESNYIRVDKTKKMAQAIRFVLGFVCFNKKIWGNPYSEMFFWSQAAFPYDCVGLSKTLVYGARLFPVRYGSLYPRKPTGHMGVDGTRASRRIPQVTWHLPKVPTQDCSSEQNLLRSTENLFHPIKSSHDFVGVPKMHFTKLLAQVKVVTFITRKNMHE